MIDSFSTSNSSPFKAQYKNLYPALTGLVPYDALSFLLTVSSLNNEPSSFNQVTVYSTLFSEYLALLVITLSTIDSSQPMNVYPSFVGFSFGYSESYEAFVCSNNNASPFIQLIVYFFSTLLNLA